MLLQWTIDPLKIARVSFTPLAFMTGKNKNLAPSRKVVVEGGTEFCEICSSATAEKNCFHSDNNNVNWMRKTVTWKQTDIGNVM